MNNFNNNFNCLNSINDLSTDSDEDSLDFIKNNTQDDDILLLNKLIQLYSKYEIKLNKINIQKKNLTNKLNNIKLNIIPLMEKNEVEFINININNGGGKLKYNKTKKYSNLSKKHLQNLLKMYFNNNIKLADELLTFLYSNREYKNKIYITKTKK
jgi:hypothetical protein